MSLALALALAVARDSTSYSRHSIHVLESSVRPMNARERASRLEMRQEARRGIREADDPARVESPSPMQCKQEGPDIHAGPLRPCATAP